MLCQTALKSKASHASQLCHFVRYAEGGTSVIYTADYNGEPAIVKVSAILP